MSPQHNLTQEHCNCLDKVIAATGPALELAKACVDCGWDFSELAAQLQAQLDQANKAKATFFPFNP
jgi:hypothetical protein